MWDAKTVATATKHKLILLAKESVGKTCKIQKLMPNKGFSLAYMLINFVLIKNSVLFALLLVQKLL